MGDTTRGVSASDRSRSTPAAPVATVISVPSGPPGAFTPKRISSDRYRPNENHTIQGRVIGAAAEKTVVARERHSHQGES
jgi:hypothetical protein